MEDKGSKVFSMRYRKEYAKSDIFMKLAFNTLLVMEVGLSITILALIARPLPPEGPPQNQE